MPIHARYNRRYVFMKNDLFQNIVKQMAPAIDKTFGVLDENNIVVACNNLNIIGNSIDVPNVLGEDIVTYGQYSLKSILLADGNHCTVFVCGVDDLCRKYVTLIVVTLLNIKNYYDEKYDKSRFIKDVILDNILPSDIYIKSRELYFDNEAARTVMVIRTAEISDVSIQEILQNIFPDITKDFVININENELALVKGTDKNISRNDLEELAKSISETLATEFYIHTVIGIGSTVYNIKNLAKSFKEAQMSLEVGKVFDNEKSILSYDNLGVARLVYQLPTTLCETFLSEILKQGTIDMLDEETLFTIQKFFENNLNVSEASRQLYIHRNTLLYRIEKVKRITGLDLKIFDHAAAFKIALMVNKYLKSNPNRF